MTDTERAQRQFNQLSRIQQREALAARAAGRDPMSSEFFRQRAKTLESLAQATGNTVTPRSSGATRTYKELFPDDE